MPIANQPNEESLPVLPVAALVVVLLAALFMGGGGSHYGLANLAVQLTALLALAPHRATFIQFWREAPLALRLLVGVTVAVPLLQLIPLPPAVWMALPSRELAARGIELTGATGVWAPFSLDPLRTLLAATALITPIAVLVIGWALPRGRLIDLGWFVVGLGLLTVMIGAFQLMPSNGEAGARILRGTFDSRNSTGLMLGFTLTLAALLPAPWRNPAILPIRLAICGLLALGIILTQSRSAFVLAALPLILGGLRMASWAVTARRGDRAGGRTAGPVMLAIAAIALGVAGTATLTIAAPGRISDTLARFEAKDDPRRFIWDDAAYSVSRYWPAGAGMGAFDEVFQIDESLENLTPRRAGRAHNDYLEVAIEAGAVGLGLIAAWFALLVWLTWRARASPHCWTAWAGSSCLLAIALQSITDYPLRIQTILAFGGFALLLLVRMAAEPRRGQS